MARTDSEQEFVLGNKQLLSAFFVVVLLLGVFFAMGYIIGHNSNNETAKKVVPVESPVQNSQSDPVPPPPQTSSQTDPAPVQPDPPKPTPEQRTPEKVDKVETKPPRETPAERIDTVPAEKPTAAAGKVASAPGRTYLQVSAVKRPAADSIVRTLKDKGFPALLGESSKPELFRVLVGPYADTESLSKAKTELKAVGFDAVVSK